MGKVSKVDKIANIERAIKSSHNCQNVAKIATKSKGMMR